MKNALGEFSKNFLKCGVTGWCMEIVFTAVKNLVAGDLTLRGITSVWMFPIYGCAAIILPLSKHLSGKPFWLRGFIYMSGIFTVEYCSGTILTILKLCPWDYGAGKWCINHLIRLDYAPFWFGAGLLFEKLLNPGEFMVLPDFVKKSESTNKQKT